MAEVAGLVIGGVGLAALFDSCMQAFEYVEAGRNYRGDYQKSALKLNLLRLRLSRWGSTVRLVEDASGSQIYQVPVASAEEAAQVEELLGDISAGLEEAEKTALRHRMKKPASPGNDETDTNPPLLRPISTAPSDANSEHSPNPRQPIPFCWKVILAGTLFISLSMSFGIYFTVKSRMGDGFTLAGWILALGAFVLAAPIAYHYPHCECWRRQISSGHAV